nr:MAG TPA: hypothetical protein [Caudoviricetes sp.]
MKNWLSLDISFASCLRAKLEAETPTLQIEF